MTDTNYHTMSAIDIGSCRIPVAAFVEVMMYKISMFKSIQIGQLKLNDSGMDSHDLSSDII